MRLLADPAAARAFLLRDAVLSAWPLCFLGSRDWPYVSFLADEAGAAGLWVLDHPWWGGSVQALGEPPALAPLVRGAALPGRAFARMLPRAQAVLAARYRFTWLDPIARMHVTPESLVMPDLADRASVLGADDGPALAALYAHWPESRFHVGRLRQGYRYVGVREGARLVAVAEHVLAGLDGTIAIVQGVLVDPRCRGRGLARAVTAAMSALLFEAGSSDVVLDVRESNASALAAYSAIGYRRHVTMLGGPGVLR